MKARTNDQRAAAYTARHGYEPTAAYCAAAWPVTGHQCELEPGHDGTHERIASGVWLTWCDEHADGRSVDDACTGTACDLRDRRA